MCWYDAITFFQLWLKSIHKTRTNNVALKYFPEHKKAFWILQFNLQLDSINFFSVKFTNSFAFYFCLTQQQHGRMCIPMASSRCIGLRTARNIRASLVHGGWLFAFYEAEREMLHLFSVYYHIQVFFLNTALLPILCVCSCDFNISNKSCIHSCV